MTLPVPGPDPGQIYGRGLGFPVRVGPDGRMPYSSGESNVRESITVILLTRPGERLMQPLFGCGLDRHLHEPATLTTLRLIQDEVKTALTRYEPRARLDDVAVTLSPQDPRAVDVSISFTLVATGRADAVTLTLGPSGATGP